MINKLPPFVGRGIVPLPVIPTEYTDALSYGEQVGTMIKKLDETVDKVNEVVDDNNEFKTDLTEQQNTFETNITNQQNTFESNITTQQNTFETNITNQQNAFESDMGDWKDNVESGLETWKTNTYNTFDGQIDNLEDAYAQFLENYQRQFGIVQTTGSSTTDAMSQKIVTDLLNTKLTVKEATDQVTDMNSAELNTVARVSTSATNCPFTNGGIVFTYGTGADTKNQIAINAVGKMFIRTYWAGWTKWKSVIDGSLIYNLLLNGGFNQLINGKFENANDWDGINATLSTHTNILTITSSSATELSTGAYTSMEYNANHKYFVRFSIKPNINTSVRVRHPFISSAKSIALDTWNDVYFRGNGTTGTAQFAFQFTGTVNGISEIKNAFVIDLTKTFGAGNEPEESECAELFNDTYYDKIETSKGIIELSKLNNVSIIVKGTTEQVTDMNNATINSVERVAVNASNCPFSVGGIVMTFGTANDTINQIAVSAENVMFYRNKWSTWNEWKQLKNYDNNYPFDVSPASISTIQKIGVIGDSFASGEIRINEEWIDIFEQSWGQVIARKNGITVHNFSAGGFTAKIFLTNPQRGLPKLLTTEKCQLYVLALGINEDKSAAGIGSVSDIGTDNDTFYGNYSKIISSILTYNSHAKIILSECNTNASGGYNDLNTAIRNIAEYFSVPTIKPYNDKFFRSYYFNNTMVSSHPNPSSYGGMANAYEGLIEKCMADNTTYFYDVAYPY